MTLLSLERPSRRLAARLMARCVIASMVLGIAPAPPPAAASPVPPLVAWPATLAAPLVAAPLVTPTPAVATAASSPAMASVAPPRRNAPRPQRMSRPAVPPATATLVPTPPSAVAVPASPSASAPAVPARSEAPSLAAPPEEQSLVTRGHTYSAGWNLVSVPLRPTDPAPLAVFSDVPAPLYLHDYVGGHTIGVGEPGFRSVVPGRVYWLLLSSAATVDVAGDLVALTEFRQPLVPGWNAVANPWLSDVDWANTRVSVRNGASTLGLGEAITQGWIEGDLTGHDPIADARITIPPNGSGRLEPWKGYLLFSNVSGELIFSAPPADTLPPQVSFDPALDGGSITEPTPIVGSVGDANLVEWRLEYAPAGTTTFTLLGQGSAPVTNGVLGTIDPTLLLNGLYTVRLIATDIANTTSTREITVVVKGNQKIGHFSVTFVDLSVPLAGMPIQVTRTYDSRDKRRGDFGVGWQLSFSNVRLGQSGVPGLGWQGTSTGGSFPTYCVQPTRSHIISITFPDGKVHEFEPVVNPSCQQFAPPEFVTMTFRPRAGTLGTLTSLEPPDAIVTGPFPGPVDIFDYNGGPFDPSAYRLTLPDGRSFVVNRANGLQSIRDRNGNELQVGAGGIVHSSGTGIAFTRDGLGRITTITDPLGNPLTYAYDANGDLVGATDREENTTTFTYDAEIPHHLAGIQDPLGRTPVRNEYDDDGRLIRHRDAAGRTIEYGHDLAGRQEIVTDRLGGLRRLVYDERGNVLEETDPEGKVTTRTYDARDNKLTETDPNNNTTTSTYDAADNITSVTDAEGNRTEFTYNARQQVLTVKDPRQKTTTNVYDAAGNLQTTTDALGNVTRFTYDTRGNVLTRTVTVDSVDLVTTFTYDTAGRIATEKDPLGHLTTYTYDAMGQLRTRVTTRTTTGGPQTLTTTYEYDRQGHRVRTTEPDGSVTRTVYDELGRPLESYDKLDRKTAFAYDELGRLTTTTYPDATFDENTYDAEGRRLTSRDRGGRVTTYSYDGVGRLTRTTYADGSFVESTYDDGGRLVSSRDPRGKVTSYEYDDAGRQTLIRDPLGHETVFTYDANGNQRTVLDARGHTTTFDYDDLNRRTRTTLPDTRFVLTAYDSLGRRVSETDQAGKTTSYTYDAVGRLIRVTDAKGKITSYAYDELGYRIRQTDANGHITQFEHDALGRETRRTLPGGAFETKVYDPAGNLAQRTDFMGRTITHAYDIVNRLTSMTYPDSTAVGFTYTPTGRRLTVTDARGTTGYGYDNRDRLTSLTYPDGRRLAYGYDAAGNRTSLTATVGGSTFTTGYAYDNANRLQTVTDPLGGTYEHGYDPNGNRISLSYPNLSNTAYAYNPVNQLTSLTTTSPLGLVQGYSFTLGPTGNRLQIDEAGGQVRSYTYDDVYRLTSETVSGLLNYGKTWTYDDVGNRLTQVTNGQGAGSVSYVYDGRDRLVTEAGAALTYDANGNLTSKAADGSVYTWDFENRLTGVTKTDGTMVAHVYDVDGVRVQTVTSLPGQLPMGVHYLVDTSGPLSHVVAESAATGAVLAYYVRGDDLLAVIRASGTRYMHADGSGSIRRLTDGSGAVTDAYDYTAFGELLSHVGTDPQPYAFAGEPLDPNVGFQYHRARWMEPSTGRFVGMDPFAGSAFDPVSLHKYLYAHANPISNSDPTGRFSLPSLTTVSAVLTTLNTISLLSTAAVFGYRAGTIANDLLIEEKIELEEALEEVKDLGADTAMSIAAYRFLNFEGLKFAGTLMRKLPSMIGRIKMWNVAHINGRLAEHYIGNAYGLFRNNIPIPSGRVPDFLTNSVLRELKNVIRLKWTRQLADMADYCVATGRKYYIHVRPGTEVGARIEAELLARFGPGSKGVLWDIITDIPEALRVIP